MAGFFSQFGEQFGTVFGHLTFSQKIITLLVAVGAIAGIFGIVHWASQPDYVTLFSNLPSEEAGRVVDWLTEQNIEYKLEQGGSSILVPRAIVYDARIRLAQEGMPSARMTGYEIFDETNLGMSEFVQQLNYRRALEGELARTIEELDEVDMARVHIVIPEEALFRDQENPTTASITLRLRTPLRDSQVNGIAHLLASSVEGLMTENVTIVDSRGNILSRIQDRDPLLALTATQLELRESVEASLTAKVETMLDQLLGPDKAIVRVSADLDFSRNETTREEYDPEMTAVRSEESIETTTTSNDQTQTNPLDPTQPPLGNTANTSEINNITNYEVTRTTSHTLSQAGGISRLSASVIIDGTYTTVVGEDGTETEQYVERTPQEINQITQVVRTALGVNDQRGDEVTVISSPFHSPEIEPMPNGFVYWLQSHWLDILRQLLIAAAVLGALAYLRNLLQRSSDAARAMMEKQLASVPGYVHGALPSAHGEGGQPLALPDIDSEMSAEVLEAQQLQQRITDFATEQPDVAARLLKTWLTADYS